MRERRIKSARNVLFRKKKFDTSAIARRPIKRRSIEMNLLADFLANRISAAGVSHVVKAPSTVRRTFWFVIIIFTAIAMTFMTYRVLREYLAYPTMMRSKVTSVKSLEFPAVTICGLSTVPKIFAKEAELFYMEEMKDILDKLPKYSTDQENKTRCLKDPLCHWSWFDDVCSCYNNPCQTLYCFPDIDNSDDKCACSMLMCQWNGSAEACEVFIDESRTAWCICTTQFNYSLSNKKENPGKCSDELYERCDRIGPENASKEFLQAVDSLSATSQIKDLMTKLKTTKMKDMRYVERFFVPPVSIMDDYGFPADSLILSCSYGMNNCRDLITLYTPSYGKCYMLNYIGEEITTKPKMKMVTEAGKSYGLQLFLRSRANDSLPLLTRQLGVRLVIHDPRSIPLTSQDGIDIRPGEMTSINLGYTEIQRLGPPWGECAEDGKRLGNYSRDPYRQNDCQRECMNMEVFHRCNCYHPKFIRATTVPHRGKICHTNESSAEDDCFRGTMQDNDKGLIKCKCPPPCREKAYEISMSTSQLNVDFFKILKTVKSLTMKNNAPSVTNEDAESGLMGVQIYYNSLFNTSIEETAIYSWESLISNIGGNMGLFLGLSLVTVLEILEFFAEIISRIAMKCKSKTSQVKDAAE